MIKAIMGLVVGLMMIATAPAQDLHEFTTQEVLNIVLDESQTVLDIHTFTSQEVLNMVLNIADSTLKVSLNGGVGQIDTLYLDNLGLRVIIVGEGSDFTYNDVDAAINVADPGDMILVLPGTYTGHIDADVDSITIQSLDGPERTILNTTIVSGAGFDLAADRVIIDGFTITTDAAGTIIEVAAVPTDVVIRNNIINSIGSATFGIVVATGGVTGLIVEGNTFYTNSGDGAVWVNKNGSNMVFAENIFFGRDSTSGYAMQFGGFNDVVVRDNVIRAEYPYDGGFASGVFPHTAVSDPHASDSVHIYGNDISESSKAVRIGHTSMTQTVDHVFVTDNTLHNNTNAVWISSDAQNDPSTFVVSGNTMYGNTADVKNNHATSLGTGVNITDSSILLTEISAPSHTAGIIFFDTDTEALSFYNNEADVKLQIGEETWVQVRNNSGGDIPDFTPVYQTGAIGRRATIAKAKADVQTTSEVVGLTTHLIENNTNGYITIMGVVNGVDTDGSPFSESWVDGEMIFLSATTAGEMTKTKPTGDNYIIPLGSVLDATNAGSFLVRVEEGRYTFNSANPRIKFKDTDGAVEDVNAYIDVNLTDTGDGTEDADVTHMAQVAGANVNWLNFDADGNLSIIPTSSFVQETYILRKHITITGMTDATATNAFTITTTDETGSTDGGAYTVNIYVMAGESLANNSTNTAVMSMTGHFGRVMAGAGTGSNTAFAEVSQSASAGEGTGAITDVDATIVETSEFVQTVQLDVDINGGTADVTIIVELLWSDFLTAPVIANS